jgi:NAD(P)H-quinone oxidoreductase subunit 4
VGAYDPPLLGVALVVIGLLWLAGAPPFQVVNQVLVRKLHPAALVPAIAAVSCAMMHLLLRVGLGAMPSAFAVLSPYLAVFGVIAVAHAALASFAVSDLVEATIHGAGAHAGIVLLGLASGTAIGIQGTELVALGGSLGAAGALAVAVAIDSRLPSAGLGDVRGVGAELVDLSVFGATLIGALALAPLSAAFLGLVLVIVGCLPFHPLTGCAMAFAAASLTVSLCRLWQRLFLGSFADAHRKLPELEPYAGRLPALTARERFGLALVSLLSSTLGLWPRPLFDVTDTTAVDYAEPLNPPGPLQVSQTPQSSHRG